MRVRAQKASATQLAGATHKALLCLYQIHEIKSFFAKKQNLFKKLSHRSWEDIQGLQI